jgi:hypothetical protein
MLKLNRLGLYTAWLIVAGMLVWAAVDRHPYSFYMLLRWICCPIFAYSAFVAYETSRTLWIWIFGVLALVYNPIFRTHLDRNTWIGVNWFTVGATVVAAAVFCRNQAPNAGFDSKKNPT